MDSDYVVLGQCASDGMIEIIYEEILQNNIITEATEIIVPVVLDENEIIVPDSEIYEDDGRKRRRIRNYENWKVHQQQSKRQRGEEYINSKEKLIKTKIIFKDYYTLERYRKYDFILKYTGENEILRPSQPTPSRRKKAFSYYLEIKGEVFRVCKPYFLGTLDVSQKLVYDVHNKTASTGVIHCKENATKIGNRKTKEEVTNRIKQHIKSFPTMESHYCRAKTSKKYLEAGLNVMRMYELYKIQCSQDGKNPVKPSYYRDVFCREFNLDFHKPKSDLCGKCKAYLVAQKGNECTPKSTADFEEHQRLKQDMRAERKMDQDNETIPVLCFDLQNVINCPRSNIGSLFYSAKLNVYNLTAHYSTTKKIYCCLWTEYTAGRTGNDLASALVKILEQVYQDTGFTKLDTWSDSCIPQNKNSFMATAILNFIHSHTDIVEITIKYSIAGHSAIQQVDNAHSQIEKVFRKNEFMSPLGLIRILKTINIRKPFCIIQMKPSDFKDFEEYSKMIYNFKEVPFIQ